jgi:uncharacterized protein (DUF1501 family)
MLTIRSQAASRDCSGVTRRDFLQAGALGLGSLSLPWLLESRSRAAESGLHYVRDKAVVLVFLSGGASHIETFNPNMDAPAPYHSVTGEVKTSIPGMTFGGTFPLIARHAHKAALVRSFTHPVGGHVQAISHVLTGGTDTNGDAKEGFSMGSLYARLRGANSERTGMPTYALMTGPEVDRQYRSEKGRVQRGSRPGTLGAGYAPFEPGGKGPVLDNMTLKMPAGRLGDRQQLLGQLDRIRHQADAAGTMQGYDKFTQQAVDLLLGGASEALDLSSEDPRLLERYDTSMFRVGKRDFRPADIGTQFLMARRLIESGCGFVTLHSAGWDMHADSNNPGVYAGMEMLGRPLDKAMSAFLEDIESRGMDRDVLVIVTGDFGRTPKINSRGGRDHWARLGTLAFFGGGLNTGQIIGQSDRNNGAPATEPIDTGNLFATVMHTLFDVGKLRLDQSVPRDLAGRIERSQPIYELFG